ncbi:MAG: hypothetical protein N2Z22_03425 [Turneriella sp.]|nr:hypothetical protein [Turneriella sp.]
MKLRPIIAWLFLSAPLLAFRPADFVPAEFAVFVEGAPLAEGLNSLRALVSNVAGEGLWSMLAANFEQRTGINLLDPQRLEGIGVRTNVPWGMVLDWNINDPADKPHFVLLIPIQNNSKLYDFIKSKIAESGMPLNQELEAGRFLKFGTEEDPGFLLRTDSAVLVGDKQDMVTALRKRASNPLSNASHYKETRSYLLSRTGNKEPLLAFYPHPRLIVSIIKWQADYLSQLQQSLNDNPGEGAESAEQPQPENPPTTPTIDENSPYIAELRDSLRSYGGALMAGAERVSLFFAYRYKESYLSDKSKIYPRILQVNTDPLVSDTATRIPVSYVLTKMQVLPLLELFRALSPIFDRKYQEGMQNVKNKLNTNLESDILGSLRGNFSLQLLRMPPESKAKNIESWEIFAAAGIKPGTANNWVNLFKGLEKLAREKEAKQKKKSKFKWEKLAEGQLVSLELVPSRDDKSQETVRFVVLIRESEIIISNNKANALKATKGGATPLSERLTKISYNAAQSIFFLDLQQILKSVEKSQQGAALKPYAAFGQKLRSFSVTSTIQGDFLTLEAMLQLLQ